MGGWEHGRVGAWVGGCEHGRVGAWVGGAGVGTWGWRCMWVEYELT